MFEALWPEVAVEPRQTSPDTRRYVRSYLIMRAVVGAIGLALPFLLVLLDRLLFDAEPFPRTSLSCTTTRAYASSSLAGCARSASSSSPTRSRSGPARTGSAPFPGSR